MKTKWIVAFALALVVNGLTGGVTIAQTQHNNGLGQSYVDPAHPLGTPGQAATYTSTMANDAANAWPVSGTISTATCGSGPTASQNVMKQTATSCAVWAYTKSMAGHVHLNTANNNCSCPTTSDPAWN
jgi:hypothetical protein